MRKPIIRRDPFPLFAQPRLRLNIAMSRLAFFLMLLAGSISSAHANLGDTVEQVVARYGKPVGYSEASATNPFGKVFFVAGGYQLVIFVLNDIEVGARLSKTDKSAFSEAEMKTIMNDDVNNSQWTPTPSTDPTTLQWSRGDKATLLYDKDKHILIFTSPVMAQALNAPIEKPVAKP